MKSQNKLSAPIIVSVVAMCLMFARVIYFFMQQDTKLVAVIPDDAFYYILLASHRVQEGLWSFDGHAPATGFHLLYAYFLTLIFSISHEIPWKNLYLLIAILATFSIGFSVYRLSKAIQNLFGELAPYWLALPFLSPIVLMQSTNLMESWLVILFAMFTVVGVINTSRLSLSVIIGLILIGVGGSFSRSDYGMLPGVIFLCLLVQGRDEAHRLAFAKAFLILLGAVSGVLLGLLHNRLISNHFLQASAQIKLYWSKMNGHDVMAPIGLMKDIVFPFNGKIPLAIFSALCIAYLLVLFFRFIRQFRKTRQISIQLTILASCFLTIIGYILFYRHNSLALQTWYVANLVVPISILFAGIYYQFKNAKSGLLISGIFSLYVMIGALSVSSLAWSHQGGMMQAGIAMKDFLVKSNLPISTRIGAWNAGIVSYFSGATIVNLDGLVNDDAAAYIKNNRLFDYILSSHIQYILDSEESMHSELAQKRGGYYDPRMNSCIHLMKVMDGDDPVFWAKTHVGLYQVNASCSPLP